MKIFAYRLKTTDDNSLGYCGIVFAKTKAGLFWVLDEFCDPYACEIMEIKQPGGVCFAINIEDDLISHDRLEVSSGVITTLIDEDADEDWKIMFDKDYDVTQRGDKKL